MKTFEIFCSFARKEFDFLVSEYGFKVQETTSANNTWVHYASVEYSSDRMIICPCWSDRDGFYFGITSKVDTFWIRPTSSHGFSLMELLRMVAPSVLDDAPDDRAAEETEAALQFYLAFYARQLRLQGESLLKGDVSLCEDMLITHYCQIAKGIPMDEYFKIFREECAGLSAEDKARVEAALATRSARPVYFALHEFVESRKTLQSAF